MFPDLGRGSSLRMMVGPEAGPVQNHWTKPFGRAGSLRVKSDFFFFLFGAGGASCPYAAPPPPHDAPDTRSGRFLSSRSCVFAPAPRLDLTAPSSPIRSAALREERSARVLMRHLSSQPRFFLFFFFSPPSLLQTCENISTARCSLVLSPTAGAVDGSSRLRGS